MTAPLYEHLKKYAAKNRISFAMPGHKNGRGLRGDLLSLDVTELSETENLYNGGEYVTEANRLLSELYGSEKSFILTGGSTAAIQAMICGAVRSGGTLLAGSDCHMSVINTCALLGINIRLFPKDIDNDFCIPKGTVSVKEYLTDDIDAVIITSPNYYGICSDIKSIAEECHSRGIPLLVDEAHGAHFISSGLFPETAVHYADAVCHSAHKTLNAMNGAAYLHLGGALTDLSRTEAALRMFSSSSPSYVIASSADTARDELTDPSEWESAYYMCRRFRESVGIRALPNDDMTRIVLNFSEFNMTGFEAGGILSDNGIDIEMADLFNIVLIVTPSNTADDMNKLSNALDAVKRSASPLRKRTAIPLPPVCTETLSPHEAFMSGRETIDIDKAAGRVSCETVVPYPPGIPVIFTGERIREEQIEYLRLIREAGGEINGLSDGRIKVMQGNKSKGLFVK